MKKFIGDKKFYKMLLAIFLPIVLQSFITQFVSLIDNIMIGQVNSDDMVGVALANQLIFIFNLAIFGSMSGAAIFATQFYGAKDKNGYQETFRFKWLICIVILTITLSILFIFNESLLNAFITSSSDDISDPVRVLKSGKSYLFIMMIGLIPFAIKEIYATSLREMRGTLFPMICGMVAIVVNLIFNYFLIFGKFGFPELGVNGAAIATVLSRFVEMLLVVIYAHAKKKRFPFFCGCYKKLFIKMSSFKKFLPKTLLLTTNEVLWSLGLTVILKFYSTRGVDVIAAFNICNTVENVFLTIGQSLGGATAIILGNYLGAKQIKEAKEASYKVLFSSFVITLIFASAMYGLSYVVPWIYNVDESIRLLAKKLIIISAVMLPVHSFNCVCYYTIRTGGKILITMCFDCLFIWAVRVPLGLILSTYTTLDAAMLYIFVCGIEIIKTIPGYILVDKGIWMKVIIEDDKKVLA